MGGFEIITKLTLKIKVVYLNWIILLLFSHKTDSAVPIDVVTEIVSSRIKPVRAVIVMMTDQEPLMRVHGKERRNFATDELRDELADELKYQLKEKLVNVKNRLKYELNDNTKDELSHQFLTELKQVKTENELYDDFKLNEEFRNELKRRGIKIPDSDTAETDNDSEMLKATIISNHKDDYLPSSEVEHKADVKPSAKRGPAYILAHVVPIIKTSILGKSVKSLPDWIKARWLPNNDNLKNTFMV